MKVNNSIIVSMYNRKPETIEVVENTFFKSISNNASQDTEVIIIDDSSPLEDETNKLVKKYIPKMREFGNIRFVRNRKNLGFAGSYNTGISMASGKNLFIVNDDVYLPKNSVSSLIDTLKEDNTIGLVGPITRWPSAFSYQHCKQAPQLKSYSQEEFDKIERFARDTRKLMHGQRIDVPFVSGFCFATTKSKIKEIGMFDTSFKYGTSEDIYLSEMMRKKYRVIVNPEVFVYHGGIHGTSISMKQNIAKSIIMPARNLFLLGSRIGYFRVIKHWFKGVFLVPIGKGTASELYEKMSKK